MALRAHSHAVCEKPLVINPWNLDALQVLENRAIAHTLRTLALRSLTQRAPTLLGCGLRALKLWPQALWIACGATLATRISITHPGFRFKTLRG